MNAWPDPDHTVIARYLGKLRLRSTNSRIYYRQVLQGFQDVAQRYPAIDRQTLEVWLREWGTCWRPSTLLHRARIVDRFLDHLVEMKMIASNPIAMLRREYSVKQSRPIWQALASSMPDQALATLRRPEPFGSVLGKLMRDRVALMRGRGYRYTTQTAWFLRFDRFLQAHPELACEPVAVMLEQWAAAKPTRDHAAECEKLKRTLAKTLRHLDPSIPARRPDTRPQQEAARQYRKPHIYSPADVRRMLDIARSYPSPRAPLRPLSLHTMLLLAYCAGLRIWMPDDMPERRRIRSPGCSGTIKGMVGTHRQQSPGCSSTSFAAPNSSHYAVEPARVFMTFATRWSSIGSSNGTGPASIRRTSYRSWRPIWVIEISTPRWSTSPSRRICCRKRASGSVWLAQPASI